MSAAKLSPPSSSSILDAQSSLPVHTRTCSAYAATTPFMGVARSISKPSGNAGMGAQPQVGDGHVSTVGNGAGRGGGVGLDAKARRRRAALNPARIPGACRRGRERLGGLRGSLIMVVVCAGDGTLVRTGKASSEVVKREKKDFVGR